jgi:hypothetical protein
MGLYTKYFVANLEFSFTTAEFLMDLPVNVLTIFFVANII